MKKLFLASLITLLSLSLALPVLANEEQSQSDTVESTKTDLVTKPVKEYQPRAVVVRGSVVTISGNTLPADVTVKLEKITPKQIKNYPGTYPVLESNVILHLTTDSKIVRKYNGQATFSELAVGDKVEANGKLQTDGSLNVVRLKDEAIHKTFYAARGEVTAIDTSANTFTVKNDKKEYKVYVTTNTKFSKSGVTSVNLVTMKVGDEVAVRGVVRQAASEITADSVVIKIGARELLSKKLENQKQALEKRIEAAKVNLAKMQTELEALLKKLSDNTTATPIATP